VCPSSITPVDIEGLTPEEPYFHRFGSVEYWGGRFVLTGEYYLCEDKPLGDPRFADRMFGFNSASDDGARWTLAPPGTDLAR